MTCTDGPTALKKGGGPAMLGIAPSFSVQALQILRALGDFGLTVDNIHIHIDHPPAAPFDTVVAVPAGADSVALNLAVILNSPIEQLTVQIELRAGSEVLYSGTQTVTASVGGGSSGPPASVPINYVGPGATLTHFSIAPHDTAILVTGSAPFRLTATDANGTAVVGVEVHWAAADASLGSVSGDGVFAPSGNSGKTYVIASTPNGLRDSAQVTISAPPTKLVLVSGGGQSGAAGAALAQPVVVQAQSANGAPVVGATINFAAANGDASVNPASAATASTGNAQTTVTLGNTAGLQTITASLTGVPSLTVSETATAGAAAQIAKASGDNQSDTLRATLAKPLVAKVMDAFGNAVANTAVTWTRVVGSGTLSAPSSTTDSLGLASVGYTLGDTARTDSIAAALNGGSGPKVIFAIQTLQRPAVNIAIVSGDAQRGATSQTLPLPLVVRVSDPSNNPSPNTTVTWHVVIGDGSVSDATSTSDSLGNASTMLTLGHTAGINRVTAALASRVNVTFTDTTVGAAGPPKNVHLVVGNNQTGFGGDTLNSRPTVQVTDSAGNPVPGAAVKWQVVCGGGKLANPATPTTHKTWLNLTADGNAQSAVLWTLGNSGTQQIRAFVPGANGDTVVFTATIAPPPTQLEFTNSFNDSYASGTHVPVVVQLLDDNGNPVAKAGVPIGIYIEFDDGCDRAPGSTHHIRALGATGRAKSLAVHRPSGTQGSHGVVAPDGCDRVGGSVGQRHRGQAVVRRNAHGVAFDAIQYGSGVWGDYPYPPDPTLIGDTIVVTDNTGKATFANLDIAGYADEDFDLVAFDTSDNSCIYDVGSDVLYLTSGAAYAIYTEYDSVHQAVAQPLVDVPEVIVTDSVGNTVANASVTFAVTGGGGSLDSTHVTTDAWGSAWAPGWTLGSASGANTLRATGAVSGSPSTTILTAIGHKPGALSLDVDLTSSTPNGGTIDPALEVAVTDSTGTWPLNASGVVITPQVALVPLGQDASTPSLSGNTSSVSTSPNGSALFTGLGISGSTESTVAITFTAPGLASVTTCVTELLSTEPLPLLVPTYDEALRPISAGDPITRSIPDLATLAPPRTATRSGTRR